MDKTQANHNEVMYFRYVYGENTTFSITFVVGEQRGMPVVAVIR